MSDQKTTLLRIGADGKSHAFEVGHAKRLLAYPNTQWQAVAEEEEGPKTKAIAAPKKAAAAANLPEVDTTGQPTSV